MLKTVIVISFFLTASLASRDIDDLENLIEYGDGPYIGASLPYPYRDARDDRYIVKPFYDESYNKMLVPAVARVPEVAAVGISKLGLVATVASFVYTLVKKVVMFVIAKGPGLLFGVIAVFGVCKFTPVCTKLSGINSIGEVQREIRSLATPERLATVSEFVQRAIRKYKSLQKSED